jgi:hypothetical protein
MEIIARKKECEFLQEVLQSKTAEFIAVYGRRRVGKTYLIHEFFKKKGLCFELTGRKGATKSAQLYNFATVFTDTFLGRALPQRPKDWDEAFTTLRYAVEAIEKTQKVIIFFDELPWLASAKSGFLEALDLFWNRYMSREPNVIVVVCGSAAEWMIKKIVSNKAGLHNRLTKPAVCLKPFTLLEAEQYLAFRGIVLDRKQLIDVYMALGGVAYYLNLVPRGKSSSEIVSSLFFAKEAPLSLEFKNLLSSLYENSERHSQVLKVLAETLQGLTLSDLLAKVKTLAVGGSASTVLEELVHCGFISSVLQFGNKKKERRFCLTDSFTLFYLKWVEAVPEVSEGYWSRKKGSASYASWSGYAFENLCLQHYGQIVKALELSVVAKVKSQWRYVPSPHSQETGVQIDLIIDRADSCINLCEIKFCNQEFVIDKDYAKQITRKKECFCEKTKTRKTVFTTLITPYGAKKEANYLSCIDGQLTMDALMTF